jgi:DNA-binding MarR family transcriptional regulator
MKTTATRPAVSNKKSPLAATDPSKSRDARVKSVERLDSLFSTLRSSKISMSACHAVVKLYMEQGNEKESLILSNLAGKLGITTAAITSVADCMEHHGLAKRQQDPNDRRIILISLTPKGIAFAETFGTTVIA